MWFSLAWIIASMRVERDAYKFFTIFTSLRCRSLRLSSHNSSRLHGFSWKNLFTSVARWYLSQGFELASLSLLQLHQPNSVVLNLISSLEFYHAGKSHLQPNPVSNCPSATGWIWHYSSWHQLYQTFLNHHFLYIPKASDSYLKISLFLSLNVGRLAFLAAFWQLLTYKKTGPS